jgi:hypothetical protein
MNLVSARIFNLTLQNLIACLERGEVQPALYYARLLDQLEIARALDIVHALGDHDPRNDESGARRRIAQTKWDAYALVYGEDARQKIARQEAGS